VKVELMTLIAILGMALATYATRLGGWLAVRRIELTGRARAALEAVPAAVLTAVIAPMALATGFAESAAVAVTGLAAIRLPLLATVTVGVGAVVVFRAVAVW
jgi:uncharacterized membrane protein